MRALLSSKYDAAEGPGFKMLDRQMYEFARTCSREKGVDLIETSCAAVAENAVNDMLRNPIMRAAQYESDAANHRELQQAIARLRLKAVRRHIFSSEKRHLKQFIELEPKDPHATA